MKEAARFIIACSVAAVIILFVACEKRLYQNAAAMTGGDPAHGKEALRRYGCDTCHTIPGVRGADALVGPPLNRMASRSYIGGVMPNTPANMIQWIQHPREVDRLTAMPDLGVTDSDARDIAGYLYTLK
jgi:cytochrome c2